MPTFACPTCQRPVEWTADAKWRPFCSERCRLIDLGAWLTEKHAIPGPEDVDGSGESGEAAGKPDSEHDGPRPH